MAHLASTQRYRPACLRARCCKDCALLGWKAIEHFAPSVRIVPIAPHSVDSSDPSQLAQCCPKRVIKAAKFLKISLVQFVQPFPGHENASQSGEGWRLAHSDNPSISRPWRLCRRILNERTTTEESKRDIIFEQMNCAAAGRYEARK
jgi:hypothetical protein